MARSKMFLQKSSYRKCPKTVEFFYESRTKTAETPVKRAFVIFDQEVGKREGIVKESAADSIVEVAQI